MVTLMGPIDKLKNKIFSKKSTKETPLTGVFDMVREFSCLDQIFGNHYDVFDKKGCLIYTIHQRPIKITQFKKMLKEYEILKKIDASKENQKYGSLGKGGRGRK